VDVTAVTRPASAEKAGRTPYAPMPEGTMVSGLESDGPDLFYAGGGPSGRVRAVRRPSKR